MNSLTPTRAAVGATLLSLATVGFALAFANPPQCAADITQAEIADTNCVIGANIGLTCVPIAKQTDARVIAIEASPQNAGTLRRNLQREGLDERVEVLNVAVADRDGSMEFELSDDNFGDHRIRVDSGSEDPSAYGEEARAVTLVRSARLDGIVDAATLRKPVLVRTFAQLTLRANPD